MARIRHTPRYGFFSKEKILPNLALLIVIAAGIFYAFYENVLYLKILSWIVIAILATIVLTRITLEIFLAQSPGVVNLINEVLYLLIGLPYLIIAGFFLPYSIYILFFHPGNALITTVFVASAAAVELAAIVYVIRQVLKDKEMTLGEYIRYIFNFRVHIRESELQRERAEEIEKFYDKIEKTRVLSQTQTPTTAEEFKEFDWKERLHELSEETIEGIPCWNCQVLNSPDATKCSNCGVSLVIMKHEEKEGTKEVYPKAKIKIDYSDQIKPITNHVILLIVGALLFSIHGIINLFDFIQRRYWTNTGVIEYVTFAIMALGLIPIGLAIRWITEDYFREYVTKRGQITQELFYAYAILVILNMILIGFPAMAAMAGLFVLVGRIVGFYMLNKTFERIKKETYLRVGGTIYILYAFYSVIVATIVQLATFGNDEAMQVWVFAFQGIIDSFLAVLVALKLIIDGLKIRAFIIEKDIKPRGLEESWILKTKVAKGEIQLET